MGTHPIFESDFDCLTDKMADYVAGFLESFDAEQLLTDAASDILSQAIVKCLNTDPKINACYQTGVGMVVPDEYVEPAKELCQEFMDSLLENFDGGEDANNALQDISDETIEKVFAAYHLD